jgi:hypothetical protein
MAVVEAAGLVGEGSEGTSQLNDLYFVLAVIETVTASPVTNRHGRTRLIKGAA